MEDDEMTEQEAAEWRTIFDAAPLLAGLSTLEMVQQLRQDYLDMVQQYHTEKEEARDAYNALWRRYTRTQRQYQAVIDYLMQQLAAIHKYSDDETRYASRVYIADACKVALAEGAIRILTINPGREDQPVEQTIEDNGNDTTA